MGRNRVDMCRGVCGGSHSPANHGANAVITGIIFYVLIVFSGTAGELCVSRAMKSIGEVTDFRPQSIARVIVRALKVPWMWIGVGMMALGFFSLLGMLAIANVSFVFPATALSYGVGAL